MKISCHKLGKRFNRDWIFRNFSYDFFAAQSYAITGANGSGKSTLLQVIAGAVASSEGSVEFCQLNGTQKSTIAPESTYQQLSIAAPYLEVVEEMTATEPSTWSSSAFTASAAAAGTPSAATGRMTGLTPVSRTASGMSASGTSARITSAA